jgi:ribose transport system substrate-binding protein
MLASFGDQWGSCTARGGSAEPGASGLTARSQRGARKTGERSSRRTAWRVAAACVSAVVVVSVAACSSASGSASSSSSASASSGSSSSSGSAQGANIAAASAALVPYTGHPSAFPVTEPLPQKLPAGKKFLFLQCGTPFCALAGLSLKAAVVAIGGTFTKLNAGTTASSAQAAASSALALKPDVVFMTVDPALFGDGLKKLSAAGVKVVSISIVKNVTPYGVTFNYIGAHEIDNDGKLLADWVIAHKGAKANAVFYGLPTFDFSTPLQQAFENEMKKDCPSCTVRTVPIDAATIGTTAPSTIVADLQAHPATNVAVFVSLQIAQGLPAAMRAAGLSGILTVGRGPTPGNLQDIKNGALTGALAIDAPVSTWTAVDSAARLLEGDQPTASEQAGDLDEQFLGQKDITFDPTDGWSGYSDFAQRYATLWHTGG